MSGGNSPTDLKVERYVGSDAVLCTFGAANLTEREAIATVERLTSRPVAAVLTGNGNGAEPGRAGLVFLLQPSDPKRPHSAVSAQPFRDGAIVSVEGDFDRDSVARVDEQAREQIDRFRARVVLDLSRSTFIDAAALHLVERLGDHAAQVEGARLIVLPRARARWKLALIPPSEGLRVVGSVEEAVAA